MARIFIAIRFNDDVKNTLVNIQNALRTKGVRGNYCPYNNLLTSSSCHPKFFVKEFCYFLMSCHQHCLGINLLVQR